MIRPCQGGERSFIGEAVRSGSSTRSSHLRGVSHALGFVVSIPLGVALILEAETGRAVAAIVFATSVVTMFGASALYHRLDQPEAKRRWLRRLDHAGVYALIAARTRRSACSCSKELAARGARIVWTGALAAILLKFVWLDAPAWLSAAIAVAPAGSRSSRPRSARRRAGPRRLAPHSRRRPGLHRHALVYAFGRPDPSPALRLP